jgi:two-component system, chemotaxis family, protein-glutamate methylesterase/glutaminase
MARGSTRGIVTAPDSPDAAHVSGIDLVVVGASAGGVGTLEGLVGRFPADLGVAVLVVLHVPSSGVSVLADILGRACFLTVRRPQDGMELTRSQILVAPTDHHLLVDGTAVRLSRGPLVNGHRPAVDPLFETAARSYGPRAMGVLLSGALDDGVAGLGAIKLEGGVTAVQDPDQAPYPGMPQAAIEAGVADYVLSTGDLARLIASAGTGGAGPLRPVEGEGGRMIVDDPDGPAVLSALTCPSCGGALWEHQRNGVVQFECRVGHQYSPASLFQIQGDAVDDALWGAHRALLERADLARRMARRLRRSTLEQSALRYDRTADEAGNRAAILNEALVQSRQPDRTTSGAS